MISSTVGFLSKTKAWGRVSLLLAVSGCVLCASCGRSNSSAGDALNIYGWSDYHDEALIREFTQATGIKVRYDVFDSSDAVEAKLLAGPTGYDIMTVSNPYLAAKFRLRSTKISIALDYQIGETQIGRSSIW